MKCSIAIVQKFEKILRYIMEKVRNAAIKGGMINMNNKNYTTEDT